MLKHKENNMKLNQKGFSVVEGLLIAAIVCIIGFTGWFVWHARNTSHNSTANTPTAQNNTKATNNKQSSNSQKTASTNSTNPQNTNTTQQSPAVTFNFVSQTGWAQRGPTDGSFTVSFGASETYGYCSDGTGILLISMVYSNANGKYTCGEIKNVVSPQSGGSLLYTQVAIGPSETLWDKPASQSVSATLSQGEKASRYDYTTVISGETYETIEYDITYQNKSYVAVNHWSTSKFPKGPNISVNYFDTIVQKTLKF